MTGPLVCHLREDATFLYDEDFAAHNAKVHLGENEDLEVVPLMDSEACLALACFLAAAHSPIG